MDEKMQGRLKACAAIADAGCVLSVSADDEIWSMFHAIRDRLIDKYGSHQKSTSELSESIWGPIVNKERN